MGETDQSNFERYEKKYLLDAGQYTALRAALAGRAEPDQYGLHTICSVYYDTDSYEIIRASLEKPAYKEKLRLRSYGVPESDGRVFLELKKKFRGVVYKRRVQLPLRQAELYLGRGIRPADDCQILNEIDWFLRRRRLSPKAFLSYDRVALAGTEDPALRVTFDRNIRWRDCMLDLSAGSWGNPLLAGEPVLLEIKTLRALPLWLSRTLSGLKIYPSSFSKYGTCYAEHLLARRQPAPKGAIICA